MGTNYYLHRDACLIAARRRYVRSSHGTVFMSEKEGKQYAWWWLKERKGREGK